ncbi:MAG: YggT family protein [Desulfuromonadales bacterium]|nr:YggT family protein [Desulfuromonadales bacterium]
MDILWGALYQVVSLVFQIYILIVVARAIVSWVNPDPYNPIVRFLHNATDPVLDRIRRVLPLQFSGIDFTPIALLLALSVLQQALLRLIARMAGGGF